MGEGEAGSESDRVCGFFSVLVLCFVCIEHVHTDMQFYLLSRRVWREPVEIGRQSAVCIFFLLGKGTPGHPPPRRFVFHLCLFCLRCFGPTRKTITRARSAFVCSVSGQHPAQRCRLLDIYMCVCLYLFCGTHCVWESGAQTASKNSS